MLELFGSSSLDALEERSQSFAAAPWNSQASFAVIALAAGDDDDIDDEDLDDDDLDDIGFDDPDLEDDEDA